MPFWPQKTHGRIYIWSSHPANQTFKTAIRFWTRIHNSSISLSTRLNKKYWIATSIGTRGSGQICLLLQNFYYPWAQNINPILDLIPCLSSTCFDSNPSSSDVLSWLILPLLPPCLGPCLPAVKVVAFVGCMDILPAPCQVSRHCLNSCFSPSVSVPPSGVYVR